MPHGEMTCGCTPCLLGNFSQCKQPDARTPVQQLQLYRVSQLEYQVATSLSQQGAGVWADGSVSLTELQDFLRSQHEGRLLVGGSKEVLLARALQLLQTPHEQQQEPPAQDLRRGDRVRRAPKPRD